MSALPILLSTLDDLERGWYLNDFGLGLAPLRIQNRQHRHRDLETLDGRNAGNLWSSLNLLNQLGERQLMRRENGDESAGAVSHIGKDGFQVCMDVAQFKPNELNVKVVDKTIIVEGKHEEREDNHGYISRHFVRRYHLPKGYDADKVQSTLSSDGVLTVSIPKPQLEQKTNERVIQIQQTGPAALNVKANTEEKVGDASNNGNLEK